jgi:hypothetical protein
MTSWNASWSMKISEKWRDTTVGNSSSGVVFCSNNSNNKSVGSSSASASNEETMGRQVRKETAVDYVIGLLTTVPNSPPTPKRWLFSSDVRQRRTALGPVVTKTRILSRRRRKVDGGALLVSCIEPCFRNLLHSPPDTAFKQQRLKAWQPILTPKTVLPTLFIIGIIFGPIGGLLIWGSGMVIIPSFSSLSCL